MSSIRSVKNALFPEPNVLDRVLVESKLLHCGLCNGRLLCTGELRLDGK